MATPSRPRRYSRVMPSSPKIIPSTPGPRRHSFPTPCSINRKMPSRHRRHQVPLPHLPRLPSTSPLLPLIQIQHETLITYPKPNTNTQKKPEQSFPLHHPPRNTHKGITSHIHPPPTSPRAKVPHLNNPHTHRHTTISPVKNHPSLLPRRDTIPPQHIFTQTQALKVQKKSLRSRDNQRMENN